MGILSDFVIAKDDDAVAIGEATRAADTWPTLESKGVDTIKISTLFCAITNTDYDDEMQESFLMVAGDEEDGPWVFKFPEDVLLAIAQIENESIPTIARHWANSEELQLDNWTEEDAKEFITNLSIHAKTAIDSEASMFLWLSL